jgi:hypothetical protein
MATSVAAADLVRLVYVSTATRPLGPEELEAIVATSRRNNAAHGLTGLLLHGGGRFYGLIEGAEEEVLARMEQIVADPRHREIRVLREDSIPVRRFASWSFGPLPPAASGEEDLAALDRYLVGARR